MRERAKRNFILQQGFEELVPAACQPQYSALLFQGRTVLVGIVAGILFQCPPVFYALCTVLWWSALLPQLNPFDVVHDATLGRRVGTFHLTPAPAPCRTAQSMAGCLRWPAGCSFILVLSPLPMSWKGSFWPPGWHSLSGAFAWVRSYITCYAEVERSPAKPCLGRNNEEWRRS